MVSFSNYSYEPSLGSRTAVGKPLIEDADVARVLLYKLSLMRVDIIWVKEEMQGRRLGASRVFNSDFFSTNNYLETGTINLMVTSPPYMNNYHYVRNTRPQLYWLNFISSPGEQKYLETNNFRQYWQTVRDNEPITLMFEHRGLAKILKVSGKFESIKVLMEVRVGPIMWLPISMIVSASCLHSGVCWRVAVWGWWSLAIRLFKA